MVMKQVVLLMGLVLGYTGGWIDHIICDNPSEILNSIRVAPDNIQQLLNAFYPINRAKPSSVIIAYFTNYTDPLPEECSLGTYPWRTYPGINYTYHNIYWYMWTTAIIFDIVGRMQMSEFGEYLPTITYYQLFNKTSPFVLPTQIACIKIPFECRERTWEEYGTVTIQIKSIISQEETNSKEKDSSKLTRVFYKTLTEGRPVVDVRTLNGWQPIRQYHSTHDVQTHQNAGLRIVVLLVLGVPYILHVIGRNHVKSLQQSRSKAKVPFFWAVASLAHVFNIYMVAKLLTVACNSVHRDENSFWTITVFTLTLAKIGILAYIHSKYITFPIPKTWNMLTNCCGRIQHKIITTISIWGIYMSVVFLLGCVPIQLLLVSVNPHLYGFGILTVWCAMFACIIITSIPFTFDQIFIKEEEFRITPKQALRQILLLMFIAVLVFGFGSLTFSITLVLHLSKYGEETRTFSSSLIFVLHHTLPPIGAWIICRVGVKVRQTVQQMLNIQDEN